MDKRYKRVTFDLDCVGKGSFACLEEEKEEGLGLRSCLVWLEFTKFSTWVVVKAILVAGETSGKMPGLGTPRDKLLIPPPPQILGLALTGTYRM